MIMTDSEMVEAARALDIDVESHRCDCEICSRTSAWCPASRSSLLEEIARLERKDGQIWAPKSVLHKKNFAAMIADHVRRLP